MRTTRAGLLIPESTEDLRTPPRRRQRRELSAQERFVERQFGMLSELQQSFVASLGLKYPAAERGGEQEHWDTGLGSADEDSLEQLDSLRARSRAAVATNPMARSLVKTWVDGVVGAGLVPRVVFTEHQRDAVGWTEDEAREWSIAALTNWKRWARRACVSGRLNHGRCQRMWVERWLVDGDVFRVRRSKNRYGPIQYSVQTIEADRVDTPPSKDGREDPSIRKGVQIDVDTGEHLAYFVAKQHPHDSLSLVAGQVEYSRLPAFDVDDGSQNVWQLATISRPDQTRGVPEAAAALDWFEYLRKIFKAELWAQMVSSCLVFVRKSKRGGSFAADERLDERTEDGSRFEETGVGIVEHIGENEEMTAHSMNRPAQTFEPFTTQASRIAGAALQTPYEVMLGDYSRTNYTSGRMASLLVHRVWGFARELVVDTCCAPDWERVTLEGILRGVVPEPPRFDEFRDLYLRDAVGWQGPVRESVEPAREERVLIEQRDAGLTTDADILRAKGRDPDEVFEQRKLEAQRNREIAEIAAPVEPQAEQQPGEDDGSDGSDGGRGAVEDAQATKIKIDAAGVLIRSGFVAEDALRAVGLDPIEHHGLLPITLQNPGESTPPDSSPEDPIDGDQPQEDQTEE